MQLQKDNITIVTGASIGLGFEKSKEFNERCTSLLVCSRNITSPKKAVSLIKGMASPERRDMTCTAGLTEFIRHLAERHNRIEPLVNEAAYSFNCNVWNKKIKKVTEQDLKRVIDIDLGKTFRLPQAAVPVMIKMGVAASIIVVEEKE